jgi:hypothetical protein
MMTSKKSPYVQGRRKAATKALRNLKKIPRLAE